MDPSSASAEQVPLLVPTRRGEQTEVVKVPLPLLYRDRNYGWTSNDHSGRRCHPFKSRFI